MDRAEMARPERFCFATAQQGSPRSAVGDPVGAVAESLSAPRCRNVQPRGRAVVDLPTFWFVGHLGFCRFLQINKLDGPPSPTLPLRPAKSRRERIQPYADTLLRSCCWQPQHVCLTHGAGNVCRSRDTRNFSAMQSGSARSSGHASARSRAPNPRAPLTLRATDCPSRIC